MGNCCNCQNGPSQDGPSAVVAFTYILQALTRIEAHVATIDETLAAQSAALDTVAAQLADLAADVAVLVSGELSTEQQAAADSITAKLTALTESLAALDTSVGDRDGSDTPPEPEPVP